MENATEQLSEYLERDITSEMLPDIKQKVQDKYRFVVCHLMVFLALRPPYLNVVHRFTLYFILFYFRLFYFIFIFTTTATTTTTATAVAAAAAAAATTTTYYYYHLFCLLKNYHVNTV